VDSCKTCQMVKISRQPTPGHYVCPDAALEPLDLVGLDTIVLGPAANKYKHKYIQVFVDHHSRYVWAFPTKTNTTPTIINLLVSLINSGVKFKRLLTDCHKSFQAKDLNKFLKLNNIKHTFSTPYHPQTNGIVERVNGTLFEKIRANLIDHPKRS